MENPLLYSLATTTSFSQYYYNNWRNKCSICMDHLRQSQEDQDAGPSQPGPSSSAVAAANVQGEPNKDISKCTNTQCQRVFHTNCLMDWFERNGATTCPKCKEKIKDADIIARYLTKVENPIR